MRGKKQYPFAEIRNFTAGRRTRSYQKESDNNGTSSLSSDDETTPKYKKSYAANINTNFNASMVKICEDLIEADNVLFQDWKIFPKSVLAPFRLFLDLKLDRLSLQQLECILMITIALNSDIVVTLSYLTQSFFFTKQVI